MSDLTELYQQLILDHGRNPRNHKALPDADCRLEGLNPLCGDRLTVYLKTEAEYITDASFEGAGCAISMASASLMTEALKGKTLTEARELFEKFHQMVTQEGDQNSAQLGKLAVLGGVSAFPARVKCATLAWHTALGALNVRCSG